MSLPCVRLLSFALRATALFALAGFHQVGGDGTGASGDLVDPQYALTEELSKHEKLALWLSRRRSRDKNSNGRCFEEACSNAPENPERSPAQPVQTGGSQAIRLQQWRARMAKTTPGETEADWCEQESAHERPEEHQARQSSSLKDEYIERVPVESGETGRGVDVDGRLRIIVCVPTMRRRSGQSFLEQTLPAVRGHAFGGSTGDEATPGADKLSEKIQIEIIVLHDEDARPFGADYYLVRKKHEIRAACGFMRWRRGLVLDYQHMMHEALEVASRCETGSGHCVEGNATYVLWLEDDALLHAGWAADIYSKVKRGGEQGEPATCLTALHPCSCERCNKENHYNGIGTVAILVR